MRIVTFKSNHSNYFAESRGDKNNTVRKIDLDDDRFKALDEQNEEFDFPRYIIIEHAEFHTSWFLREITDYREYEGMGIISWKHKE